MMRIAISSLLVCVVCINSLAQTGSLNLSGTGGSSETADIGLTDVMRKIRTTDNEKLVKVLGSPYLDDAWRPVKLVTVMGAVVRDIKLKYNCYSGDLLGMKEGSTDSVLIKTDLIGAFQYLDYRDSVILFKKLKISNNQKFPGEPTFYQVLSEGKISLIKFYSKKIRHFDTETSSIVDTNQPRLVDDNELFLLKEDGTNISCTKQSKKRLIEFFGYQESKIKSYVKMNGLNFRSEIDIKQILKEYERLANN